MWRRRGRRRLSSPRHDRQSDFLRRVRMRIRRVARRRMFIAKRVSRAGDQAARAALGRGQHPLALLQLRGEALDQKEFLLAMLMETGKIDHHDLMMFIRYFRRMDATQNGLIDLEDLESMAKLDAEGLRVTEAVNRAKAQGRSLRALGRSPTMRALAHFAAKMTPSGLGELSTRSGRSARSEESIRASPPSQPSP